MRDTRDLDAVVFRGCLKDIYSTLVNFVVGWLPVENPRVVGGEKLSEIWGQSVRCGVARYGSTLNLLGDERARKGDTRRIYKRLKMNVCVCVCDNEESTAIFRAVFKFNSLAGRNGKDHSFKY